MKCYNCGGKMVEVKLIKHEVRKYDAMVCVECGRIHSRYKLFKDRG